MRYPPVTLLQDQYGRWLEGPYRNKPLLLCVCVTFVGDQLLLRYPSSSHKETRQLRPISTQWKRALGRPVVTNELRPQQQLTSRCVCVRVCARVCVSKIYSVCFSDKSRSFKGDAFIFKFLNVIAFLHQNSLFFPLQIRLFKVAVCRCWNGSDFSFVSAAFLAPVNARNYFSN